MKFRKSVMMMKSTLSDVQGILRNRYVIMLVVSLKGDQEVNVDVYHRDDNKSFKVNMNFSNIDYQKK